MALNLEEEKILDNKLKAIDKEIEAIEKAAEARRKAREGLAQNLGLWLLVWGGSGAQGDAGYYVLRVTNIGVFFVRIG